MDTRVTVVGGWRSSNTVIRSRSLEILQMEGNMKFEGSFNLKRPARLGKKERNRIGKITNRKIGGDECIEKGSTMMSNIIFQASRVNKFLELFGTEFRNVISRTSEINLQECRDVQTETA